LSLCFEARGSWSPAVGSSWAPAVWDHSGWCSTKMLTMLFPRRSPVIAGASPYHRAPLRRQGAEPWPRIARRPGLGADQEAPPRPHAHPWLGLGPPKPPIVLHGHLSPRTSVRMLSQPHSVVAQAPNLPCRLHNEGKETNPDATCSSNPWGVAPSRSTEPLACSSRGWAVRGPFPCPTISPP